MMPDEVIKKAKQLEQQGYKEIVITGIEISSYGKDLSCGTSLNDIIHTVSAAVPSVRLRLGSLDPAILSDDFISKIQSSANICEHFHLSLQSGCDETLRRMNRKYDTAAVLKAITLLRRYFPGCGITADLITGFPGETDEEFEKTLEFIKKAEFSDMHIFPFSPRPGTKAAGMPDQMKKSVIKERAKAAADSAEQMANAFKASQIGSTTSVLFETESGGISKGHTRNYLEVTVKRKIKKNSVQFVQITGVESGTVWGEINGESN